MSIDTLNTLAKAYASHTGLKISTVSSYATNDGKWLKNIISGEAGCTLRRLDRVVCWFSDHWPSDLAWPSDIPRPAQSKKEAA